MKTKNILSFVIFAVVLDGSFVGAASQIDGWSNPTEIALPSEGVGVKAVVRNYRNGCLVFVPEKQLIWVGSVLPQEHQKYVCLSNAVVRIATDCDILWINRQAIRLEGLPDEKAKAKAQIMTDFENKLKNGFMSDNIRISLGEVLLGNGSASPFLPLPERVRPAKAAAISNIQIERDNMTVTLIGEKDVKVVLVFDDSMNVIKGMIGDKECYSRTTGSTNGVPSLSSTNIVTK